VTISDAGARCRISSTASSTAACARAAGERSWKDRQQRLTGALEFFNGFGGFDKNGTEYVTVLDKGAMTPAPQQCCGNPNFGFQAAAEAAATAGRQQQDFQLTAWGNDAVSNRREAFYVKDENSGLPARRCCR
jgi:cellobiose phosphorylase